MSENNLNISHFRETLGKQFIIDISGICQPNSRNKLDVKLCFGDVMDHHTIVKTVRNVKRTPEAVAEVIDVLEHDAEWLIFNKFDTLDKLRRIGHIELEWGDIHTEESADEPEDSHVQQFLDAILPQLQWNLVPNAFLYELYKRWHPRHYGITYHIMSRKNFIKVLNDTVKARFPEWEISNGGARRSDKMSKPEPLIEAYGLDEWKEIAAVDADPHERYRGILRRKV